MIEEGVISAEDTKRIIGTYEGESSGPVIIVTGGLHGNEPAGIIALNEVFRKLKTLKPEFSGKFIGIAGNLKALQQETRFLDCDLNRIWNLEPTVFDHSKAEFEEYLSIKAIVDAELTSSEEVIFLDLHTTSSPSRPFLLVDDNARAKEFVEDFPSPAILNVSGYIHGTLLEYVAASGNLTIGFEAGQHQDPEAAKVAESMVWMILHKAGCLESETFFSLTKWYNQILLAAAGVDGFYRVVYRYGIEEEERFYMRPGYKNFEPISTSDLLAENLEGPIYSPYDGFIFMPLYQSQGDDGFFIIQKEH